MDEVYLALEKLENGADLVAKAKAEVAKVADAEARQRIAERSLKAFEGVDIAEVKALKVFADANGGVSAITEKLGKLEQTEAEKLALAKSLEDHGKTLEAEKLKTSEAIKANERLSFENSLAPFFGDNFRNSDYALKMAIDYGILEKTEAGIIFKNGAVTKPFDDTAKEELKKHEKLSFLLKTPTGGGEGGGVNGDASKKSTAPFWKSKIN